MQHGVASCAIEQVASLHPNPLIVISDGEPDDARAALDAVISLGCVIQTFYCGDETNRAAISFLRDLALRSRGGIGRMRIGNLAKPEQLAADLRPLLAGPARMIGSTDPAGVESVARRDHGAPRHRAFDAERLTAPEHLAKQMLEIATGMGWADVDSQGHPLEPPSHPVWPCAPIAHGASAPRSASTITRRHSASGSKAMCRTSCAAGARCRPSRQPCCAASPPSAACRSGNGGHEPARHHDLRLEAARERHTARILYDPPTERSHAA